MKDHLKNLKKKTNNGIVVKTWLDDETEQSELIFHQRWKFVSGSKKILYIYLKQIKKHMA